MMSAELCLFGTNESTLLWNESSSECFSSSSSSSDPPSNSSVVISGSNSIAHIFQGFVIAIGLIGVGLNGLILRVLLMPHMRKQKINLLIINQILIDFASSIFLIATYIFHVLTQSFYYEGETGYALCVIFYSDLLIFALQAGSNANLVLIAIERYLKIVHHIFHSTYIKRWMFYVGIAFTWIDGIVLDNQTLPTSRVIDGQCFYFYFWPSGSVQQSFMLFVIIYQFLLPLAIFIFCYGRILYFVRKKSRVLMSNIGPASDHQPANQIQAMMQQREMNVIATMIVISVVFAVSWFSNQIWAFLYTIKYTYDNSDALQSFSVFLIFLNVCLNPFIYAVKHRAVNQNLKAWLCRKASANQIQVIDVYQTRSSNLQSTHH